jgi:hypothetical protein
MRWRCGIGVEAAIGIAFLAIGMTLVHSHSSVQSQSRGSGASTPVAFVGVASFAQLVQSSEDAGDRDQNAGILQGSSGPVGTLTAAIQVVEQARAIDGPLYKRPPPPSFS